MHLIDKSAWMAVLAAILVPTCATAQTAQAAPDEASLGSMTSGFTYYTSRGPT